ncbi:hypothetical protein [Asaia platycodi]|uniref:hypothetical protein n=1 Tax=Asaia platycodi TaxID=610243 RepID=UPI000B330261|nr:hypothetical protein [Asaia platycodi]
MLAPLYALAATSHPSPALRGLTHRLMEYGGVAPLLAAEPGSHGQQALGHFRRLGILFCPYGVFMPLLLKPAPMGIRAFCSACGIRRRGLVSMQARLPFRRPRTPLWRLWVGLMPELCGFVSTALRNCWETCTV